MSDMALALGWVAVGCVALLMVFGTIKAAYSILRDVEIA